MPRPAADLPSALDAIDRIFATLADKRVGVFLDYDGTLTPIVSRPADAVLDDDMRGRVAALADCCTVAVVSGRDRDVVTQLVGLPRLIYVGSHGFDIRGPGGLSMQHEFGVSCLPELDAAESVLRGRVGAIPGVYVERKRFGLTTHVRNVADDRVDDVSAAVDAALAGHDRLFRKGGKKVFEIVPAIDWHKGKAVRWLMDELHLAGSDSVTMYMGDDLTDEDAIAAIKGDGIGVLVGDHGHPTHAQWRLNNVSEVGDFLEALTQRLSARQAS